MTGSPAWRFLSGPRRARGCLALDRAVAGCDDDRRGSGGSGHAGLSCPRRSTSLLRAASWRKHATPSRSSSRSRPRTSDPVRGGRPDGEGRVASRRGPAFGGVAVPGAIVAAVDGQRPALRERRARLRYAEAIAAEGDEATAPRTSGRRAVSSGPARRSTCSGSTHCSGGAGARGPHRQRVTRTFMFTDIVTSTDLIALVGDEAWAELLSWHNRELRSAFASHRGEEVKSTGDGFFVTFDEAAEAIECAVDIQRRLTRHRRDTGSRPRCGSVCTRRSDRMAVTTAAVACTSRPASAARHGARSPGHQRGSRAGRAKPVQASDRGR